MASEVRDPLENMLKNMEQPEFQEALNKLIMILKNMEESGLLDLLEAVTNPLVIERIMQLILTTGLMRLGDKIDSLLDMIGDMAATMTKPVEPISLSQLLASLRDPDVAKGLARAIQILRILGKFPERA